MDVTANQLLAAGTPGYTSVTLICLIIIATLFRNFSQKMFNFHFSDKDTEHEGQHLNLK